MLPRTFHRRQEHANSRKNAAVGGFSLVELLMAMAVVGILATFTLPAYSDYQRRAQLPEAFNGLAEFRAKMEHYYQDHGSFAAGENECADPTAGNWTRFTSANAPAFIFQCTASRDGQGYVISATGKSGTPAWGYQFSIDHAAQHRTLLFRGTEVAANCWLTSRSSC